MNIAHISNITFGYKSILKTHWLNGKMPSVTCGIYGGKLTKDNVTLEHIKPHSKGGKTSLNNLALSVCENNWKRGNQPISNFLTKENFDAYCEQFKGIKLPYFNGDNYIKEITKNVERLLKQGK